MKLLLLDNLDSFTLNIAQYLYEVTGIAPVVAPNTMPFAELPLGDVNGVDGVVISPGPGRPSEPADFGVCREVIARSVLPMLGVCLGHQGIAEFFGARTVHAPEPAHAHVDTIKHTGTGLFEGLPQDLPVVRYHSLISVDLPDDLEVTAWTGDGLVMAFAHRHRPIWGVQFHPESIATCGGHAILANYVRMAAAHRTGAAAATLPGDVLRPDGQVEPDDRVRPDDQVRPYGRGRLSPAAAAFGRVGGAASLRLEYQPIEDPGLPEDMFRSRYADRPHAFWLDAENCVRPGSQVSMMGATGEGSVVLSYDLADRRLTLSGAEATEMVDGDAFDLLEDVLAGVAVETPPAWPWPFNGGLVGYFGYELKALTTGAERHRAVGPDAWFLHARQFVLFDHVLGRAYDCRLVSTDGQDPASLDPLLDEPAPNQGPPAPPPAPADGEPGAYLPGPVAENELNLRDDHDTYLAKIARAQELIVDGETYEVCLTNSARLSGVGAGLPAYGRMRRISPVPYGAYLRVGDTEVLSSSPERFLHIGEDRVVESRPIKGTRPRGTTVATDEALKQELLTSDKDRAENLMIVDLVRHDLNAVCEPGSVHVPDAFTVESFSSVHQLVSTVRGRLRWDRSALDAVRACFPGGSMTGAPKIRTMEIIDALEGTARGIYSGSIGWLSFSGALDLSIVIRTAVVRDGEASFGVGGAITAKSDPEQEFQETLVKSSVPHFGLRGWRARSLPG